MHYLSPSLIAQSGTAAHLLRFFVGALMAYFGDALVQCFYHFFYYSTSRHLAQAPAPPLRTFDLGIQSAEMVVDVALVTALGSRLVHAFS